MNLKRPAYVFILIALAGVILTSFVYWSEQRSRGFQFQHDADIAVANIEERLSQHVALLVATRSWFETIDTIPDKASFREFTEGLNLVEEYAGIQGVGFALLTSSDDTSSAETLLQLFHGDSATIRPETDQANRTPIVLLEPLDERNAEAIGYDMFAQITRRTAMERALAENAPRASGPVELVQEITADRQAGFLIYLPTTIRDRAGANQTGFTYAPFRVGNLINATLLTDPDTSLYLSIRDTAEPDLQIFQQGEPDKSHRVTTRDLDVYGRVWTFNIGANQGYLSRTPGLGTVLVGVLSFVLAYAGAQFIDLNQRQIEQARTSAREAEERASERGFLLDEMKHRIKNHIARIQGIARMTERESMNLGDFSMTFNSRLAAMAAAQDALVQGGVEGAAIRQVITQELNLHFDATRTAEIIDGPDIPLTARQGHALGLVTHELMTNGMKHGDLAEAPEKLRITWEDDAQGLTLLWSETGASEQALSASKGFGTKLLEVCVKGELKGTITRSQTDDRLEIKIWFPLDPSQV